MLFWTTQQYPGNMNSLTPNKRMPGQPICNTIPPKLHRDWILFQSCGSCTHIFVRTKSQTTITLMLALLVYSFLVAGATASFAKLSLSPSTIRSHIRKPWSQTVIHGLKQKIPNELSPDSYRRMFVIQAAFMTMMTPCFILARRQSSLLLRRSDGIRF